MLFFCLTQKNKNCVLKNRANKKSNTGLITRVNKELSVGQFLGEIARNWEFCSDNRCRLISEYLGVKNTLLITLKIIELVIRTLE